MEPSAFDGTSASEHQTAQISTNTTIPTMTTIVMSFASLIHFLTNGKMYVQESRIRIMPIMIVIPAKRKTSANPNMQLAAR